MVWPLNLETKEEGLSTRPVRLLCAAAAVVDHFLRQLKYTHTAAFLRQNAAFCLGGLVPGEGQILLDPVPGSAAKNVNTEGCCLVFSQEELSRQIFSRKFYRLFWKKSTMISEIIHLFKYCTLTFMADSDF